MLTRAKSKGEIIPGVLYLGRAGPPAKIKSKGIVSILNVARRSYGEGTGVYHVPLRDGAEDPARLLVALRTVQRLVLSGRVPLYVHCAVGRSRSPIVVAMYLVAAGRARTLGQALALVKSKRPVIAPSPKLVAAANAALKRALS